MRQFWHTIQARLTELRRDQLKRGEYVRESRIGYDSGNQWIGKSANILGWLHEGEAELLWELAMRPIQGHILEIGTWQGKSTCILAGSCIERADDSVVVCIDTFQMDGTSRQVSYYRILHRSNGTFYEFIENARQFGFLHKVIPIAIPSSQAHLILSSMPIRLAFIDGRHDYPGVREDINLVLPLIVPGGIIAFHDVVPHYSGVILAIKEMLEMRSDIALYKQEHCLTAYVRKVIA